MKNKEIKKLSIDELKKKVSSLKRDLFNIRFKKVNGQLEDPSAEFRLVTSGNQVLTTGNLQYIYIPGGNPASTGKVWHVPLASGDKAYIEASGNFLDSSTIAIHRI